MNEIMRWVTQMATYHHVNPWILGVLLIPTWPLIYMSAGLAIKAIIQQRTKRTIAFWVCLVFIFDQAPYVYVLVFGRKLAWYHYVVLALLVLGSLIWLGSELRYKMQKGDERMKLTTKIQGWMLSHPSVMQGILHRVPTVIWEKMARKRALSLARRMTREVPAYQEVLLEAGLDPQGNRSFEEFPILTKTAYIMANQDRRASLFLGDYPRDHCLAGITSGTTGEPLQWPTLSSQQFLAEPYLAGFLQQMWQVDKIPTSFIVGMALGNYFGTNRILHALVELQIRHKFPFMVYVPGEDIKEMLRNLHDDSWNPQQRVVLTFPGTLQELLDVGDEKGIDWPRLNIKIWSGGQLITNAMRTMFTERLGHQTYDLTAFVVGYGSADSGHQLGNTNVVTRLIEMLSIEEEGLAFDLFAQKLQVPLLQVNPLNVYLEEGPEQHLLATIEDGIPICRYDTNDRGVIISWNHVVEVLADHGIDLAQELEAHGYPRSFIVQWPLLLVYGRSDEVAIANALKFPPEHIVQTIGVWEQGGLVASFRHQGGLLRYTVHLEMRGGFTLTEKRRQAMEVEFAQILRAALDDLNDDWRGLELGVKTQMGPIVRVWLHGAGPFRVGGPKALYLLSDEWRANGER